jgi:23S rRNA (cytosine1962-C5)-methyltransferase
VTFCPQSIHIDYCQWPAYTLIDTGEGKKLERFGPYTVVRSEPKAWWPATHPQSAWKQAIAVHQDEKRWVFRGEAPKAWPMKFGDITLQAKFFNTSKHLGVFPEQSSHWAFLQSVCRPGHKVLSLFGYTGAASLIAAQKGCHVTHVDASKPALTWARTNQALSGLDNAPIRWILEDAKAFVKREVRRGSRYDILILDPPAFGRGPDGQVWKVEADLPLLLEDCARLLSQQPVAIVLTLYALEASSLMAGNSVHAMMRPYAGHLQVGELVHQEQSAGRLLPLSLYARWQAAQVAL